MGKCVAWGGFLLDRPSCDFSTKLQLVVDLLMNLSLGMIYVGRASTVELTHRA